MSVRYPVAVSAEEALGARERRAVREREALELAGGMAVAFARELVGPVFATREAAEAAWPGVVDREGAAAVQPEDRFCELMEVLEPEARRGGQAEPVFEAGSRWPKPRRQLKTQWRLQVSYWRIVDPAAETAALPQARSARRTHEGESLDAKALHAMARQPLAPVKPQQPLDIGLFEYSPPEAPHLTIPDE
jgi:hypothetical protein